MNTQFRMSRLQYPRTTFLSVILLFCVFGLFGLWANAQPVQAEAVNLTQVLAANDPSPYGKELCVVDHLRMLVTSR